MTTAWPDSTTQGGREWITPTVRGMFYAEIKSGDQQKWFDDNEGKLWRWPSGADGVPNVTSPPIKIDLGKTSGASPPPHGDPDHLDATGLAYMKWRTCWDHDNPDLVAKSTVKINRMLADYDQEIDVGDHNLDNILQNLIHAHFTDAEIPRMLAKEIEGQAALADTDHSFAEILKRSHANYDLAMADGGTKFETAADPEFVMLGDYDPKKLLKRDWIIDDILERSNMGALAGTTGAAKSTLSIAMAMQCASGLPFGPFKSKQKYRVGMMNAEDNINEQQLRFDAMLKVAPFASLTAGRDLFRGLPIFTLKCDVMSLVRFNNDSRKIERTATYNWLVGEIVRLGLDIIFIDPLVEISEDIDENSNPQMHGVMALLRTIARSLRVHVCIIHHFNKPGGAQNVGAIRGASAIASSVRSMINIEKLSEADAKLAGISDDDRHDIVKMICPKANNTRTGGVHYFRLVPQELANGETVASIEPYHLEHVPVTTALVIEFLNKVAVGRLADSLPFTLATRGERHTRADCIMTTINIGTVRKLLALGYLGDVEFKIGGKAGGGGHTKTGLKVIRRPSPGEDWNPDPFTQKGDA